MVMYAKNIEEAKKMFAEHEVPYQEVEVDGRPALKVKPMYGDMDLSINFDGEGKFWSLNQPFGFYVKWIDSVYVWCGHLFVRRNGYDIANTTVESSD